ncbi:hypothetical protein [Allobaculum sp. Allo2]|uniref:hypothetical protein n=1 Tax=Allobaculum sp. Allo2 TaxID=2853432 RepID=UPI001F60B9FC|nr:hypothetical protein [Allobaculum sp. Allo2]UNT93284.1 hypothetical protein KWG61_15180 [Allobaculum sp. Allo2]
MGIRDFAINAPQNKPEKSFPQGPDKTEMRLSGLYTGIQMQKKISKMEIFSRETRSTSEKKPIRAVQEQNPAAKPDA